MRLEVQWLAFCWCLALYGCCTDQYSNIKYSRHFVAISKDPRFWMASALLDCFCPSLRWSQDNVPQAGRSARGGCLVETVFDTQFQLPNGILIDSLTGDFVSPFEGFNPSPATQFSRHRCACVCRVPTSRCKFLRAKPVLMNGIVGPQVVGSIQEVSMSRDGTVEMQSFRAFYLA